MNNIPTYIQHLSPFYGDAAYGNYERVNADKFTEAQRSKVFAWELCNSPHLCKKCLTQCRFGVIPNDLD